MKSLAFFLSLVMTCLASNTADVSVRKPLDYVVQNNTTLITMSLSSDLKESVNTGLAVSEVTVNSAQLLLKGVQSIVRSKLLKVMSSFLGPAGAVIGVIGDVMGLFEDKAPEIEQLFAAQTAFISESFIAMSNQLDRLSAQMSAGENKILTAIQYQPVHEKISQIDACLDMIPTIIKSFPNNSVRLIASIDEQLTTYGNLDTDLTNLVFGSSPASQQSSIIDSIATLCAPDSQSCQTVSSTNQVFYEFHKHIMVYIAKGNEFQTICYQIKELVTQVDHSEDIEFARNKMESNMQKVMMSLNETLIKYKDSSYQKSHMHLIVQPVENGNYVKPKNSEKITNGYQSHYNFYTGLIVVKTAGHVITGVRFAKKDNTIFIQIQTGLLLPLGMIDSRTVLWQELPPLGYAFTPINRFTGMFFLADLVLPKKYALTGVQFIKCNDNDVSIGIKGTSFNYLSGTLNKVDISRECNLDPFYIVKALSTKPCAFISNKMVLFIKYGYPAEPWPYFDTQRIELSIPAPLSGLQLVHYCTVDYEFVRLRISPINYLHYLLTTSSNRSTEEWDGDINSLLGLAEDWHKKTLPISLSSSDQVYAAKTIVFFALLIAVMSYF